MGPSGAVRPGLDIDLGEDIDTGDAHAARQANAHHCFLLVYMQKTG